MKVILREDIKRLGAAGEVVEVKEGYGRNYLIPRNLAVSADAGHMRQLEHERKVLREKKEKSAKEAKSLADKIAAKPDDLPVAFHDYQQERYLRTGRTQIMARVYGEFYHARGVAAELRDMALVGRTPQQSYDGIAWLYGGP